MHNISTSVPQGSILGPILFIIYINDFIKASQTFNFLIHVDDTTLSSTRDSFSTCENIGNVECAIDTELNKTSKWLKLNKLSLNISKTEYILLKTARRKT